jgi:GNAT superfamily N-acetyltransferase
MAKKHLNLNQFQISLEHSDERLPFEDGRYPMYTTLTALPNDGGSYTSEDVMGRLVLHGTGDAYYSMNPTLAPNSVESLEVEPEHRGKGVGSALMGAAMKAYESGNLVTTRRPTAGPDLPQEQADFVNRRLKNS